MEHTQEPSEVDNDSLVQSIIDSVDRKGLLENVRLHTKVAVLCTEKVVADPYFSWDDTGEVFRCLLKFPVLKGDVGMLKLTDAQIDKIAQLHADLFVEMFKVVAEITQANPELRDMSDSFDNVTGVIANVMDRVG